MRSSRLHDVVEETSQYRDGHRPRECKPEELAADMLAGVSYRKFPKLYVETHDNGFITARSSWVGIGVCFKGDITPSYTSCGSDTILISGGNRQVLICV